MNTSPVQRIIAVLGMACLIPIAAMLTTDAITLEAAAIRAAAILVAGVTLQWVIRTALELLAIKFESHDGPTNTGSDADLPAQRDNKGASTPHASPAGAAEGRGQRARDTVNIGRA